jgi:hypothetical protein
MSFRLSSLRVCCGLVAVAVSGLLPCGAQTSGRPRSRPIEYSDPKSDEVTTNLHQLTIRRDGMKELEEDLYQPLRSFTPQSSLDGVTAPLPPSPAPPAIQSKRAKELLERRKNWLFARPEDLVAEPTLEEILKTPEYGKDGREKKQTPALDRYYELLATKRSAANRPDQLKDNDLFGPLRKSSPGDETAARGDSDLPNGLKESAQALKNLFGLDAGGDLSAQSGTRGSFSDPFGLGDNTLSKEQVLEHNKIMDQYNSALDPNWHRPAAANPFNQPFGLPEMGQLRKGPAAGLASSPTPAPHTGLDAQMDVLNPMLGPAGLPDVNARALGQTRPALPLPSVETPKVGAPAFVAPRRSF